MQTQDPNTVSINQNGQGGQSPSVPSVPASSSTVTPVPVSPPGLPIVPPSFPVSPIVPPTPIVLGSSSPNAESSHPQDLAPSVSSGGSGQGPSKLFYCLLGITLFVFVAVVVIVILTLKGVLSTGRQPVIPSITQSMVRPSTVSPSLSASDSATTTFLQQSNSDTIADIDKDIQNTNLGNLDQETSSIEGALP